MKQYKIMAIVADEATEDGISMTFCVKAKNAQEAMAKATEISAGGEIYFLEEVIDEPQGSPA